MKRNILAMIVISVVLIMSACSSAQNQTPSASEPAATSSQPASEEPAETSPQPEPTESAEAATEAPSLFDENGDPTKEMSVTSTGIVDGVIDPVYGTHGDKKDKGVPTLSFPLEISGVPAGAVCLAVYMDDLYFKKPDCWVHWMVVNIKQRVIPEDFSLTAGDDVIQGTNDFNRLGYGGPTPPEHHKYHTYGIKVYALDAELDLKSGFTREEFEAAIKGHIIAECTLEGKYNAVK